MHSDDFLQLSDLKIFQKVQKSFQQPKTKSSNLLTVKDGVVFTWDFENNCVLSLNLKAARSRDGDQVHHQSLLPLTCVQFTPEYLLANDAGSLLIVAGSSGVLVLQLPARYPPFGAFDRNKEVIGCRSYPVDERFFLCSETGRVRQVKFHPGSPRNNHILILTADNTLRLYLIDKNTVFNLSTYQIGQTPVGLFPRTKLSYLDVYGEVGVDFDFGQPEIVAENELQWPIYVLRGDGAVFTICIDLINQNMKPKLVEVQNNSKLTINEACSILCLKTSPEIVCIAYSNGTISHSILFTLDPTENETSKYVQKELLCFETIELELGLSTTSDSFAEYKCPIFLHKDETKPNRYFATHETGIHSVMIKSAKNLQTYCHDNAESSNLNELFLESSKAEYLVCTKTSSDTKPRPIVGFSLYYPPSSLIALLADGKPLSLALPAGEPLARGGAGAASAPAAGASPLKQMLVEPFDRHVERILQRGGGQPLLKLAPAAPGDRSQRECYELLQRAGLVLRERFDAHRRAKAEIEKRVRALQLLRDYQTGEIAKIADERNNLQDDLGNLAEKYEDIKDRQDAMMKRCEELIVMVLQKKPALSESEEGYFKELADFNYKLEFYKESIQKLKTKMNYQRYKIVAGKAQDDRIISNLKETHTDTIKANLKDMSDHITQMVKEVGEYKDRLCLK